MRCSPVQVVGLIQVQILGKYIQHVGAAFGNVVVAESSDGVLFRPLTNFGNVSAAAVTSISVAGGDEANTIDLSGVAGASFTSLTLYQVACNAWNALPVDPLPDPGTSTSGLLYLGSGNWQFNWKTMKSYAGQCRIMTVTLGDGSTHSAEFKFK